MQRAPGCHARAQAPLPHAIWPDSFPATVLALIANPRPPTLQTALSLRSPSRCEVRSSDPALLHETVITRRNVGRRFAPASSSRCAADSSCQLS